jgi:hypothetical protein
VGDSGIDACSGTLPEYSIDEDGVAVRDLS